MLFASPIFLFTFLPLVLIINYVIDLKYKNLWLFLSSFVFYAWGGIQYAVLVLALCVLNWILAILMNKSDGDEKHKKKILILALLANFATLGFFKYFNFLVANIESILRIFIPDFTIPSPNIPLPIGISFFTFQIVSYVIDLYRGQVTVQRSFINLSLYVMLFPQLIAGPIVRYIDVEAQIQKRSVDSQKFALGIERFIIGFSKKLVLANTSGRIADAIINAPAYYSTPACWFGILCYAFQIYFDFSGYSDMAIGLGKMLGFDFLENFNFPYVSNSIQEFWRRWHISLSSWFRDYLYIPLGGSRKGMLVTYRNLIIVFFVTGLWHGASWNYVVWGLWHGAFLIIERLFLGRGLKRIPSLLARLYTIVVVLVGWVLFRIENLHTAIIYLKTMFGLNMTNWSYHILLLDKEVILILCICMALAFKIIPQIRSLATFKTNHPVIAQSSRYAALLLIFIVATLYMTGSNFNPFIYFRF